MHLIPSSGRNPWLTDVVREMRSREGLSQSIITLQATGQLHADMRRLGVDTYALSGGSSRDPMVIVRLARVLSQRQPEIVHTHVLEPALAYAIGRRLSRTRAVWVSTRHQQPGFIDLAPLPPWKRKVFRALDGWVHRQMDTVIAISMRSAGELQRLGVNRIAMIPLGFDLQRLVPDPDQVAAARREIGAIGSQLAVCVARLSWEKNLSFLLRAWVRVRSAVPNARLAIVGAGPLDAELRAEADALGLSEAVLFLGFRPDALQLIGAADVVVQPSLTENMSMVGVEALAQGRPLVSTPVGIIGEHILDGAHCLVAPAHDAPALAARIVAVLRDPVLGRKIGDAGRRLINEKFGITQMAGEYQKLYLALFGDRAPPL